MQEPKEDKDEEFCKKINELVGLVFKIESYIIYFIS